MNLSKTLAVVGALAALGVAAPRASAQDSWLQQTFTGFQVQGPHQQAVDVIRSTAEQIVHRLTTTAGHLTTKGLQNAAQYVTRMSELLKQQLPGAFAPLASENLQFGG